MTCRKSEDVFNHFKEVFGVDGDGDISAIAMFAYGLVEKERFEWIEHCRKDAQRGEPSSQEIERWYLDLSDEYFRRKEDEAARWYSAFARIFLADEIDEQTEAAKNSAIQAALNRIESFWPMFWKHNLIGVTANIIFAILLIIFVIVISTDFSIVTWAKHLVSGK